MNVHRSLWLSLPLALLLPVGCADNSGSGQANEPVAAATAAAITPAPAAEAHHRHGHHGRSPAGMLFHAARQLDLTEAQRSTVDQLSQQLHGSRGGARAEHQAVQASLVEGVRAGSIDMTRVAPLQASADAARQARAQREATALNGLWNVLQPAQRQTLVSNVRAKQADHAERWNGQHEGHAAGAWQQKRLDHLTAQLDLDAAQQQKVAALLAAEPQPAPAARQAQHQAMKARTEALLTAFAADSFDAQKLDLAPAAEHRMGAGQHRAQFLAQLVPVLRADQREKLAVSMENERS
jgi:Spy/CpxP family protein refolding chaperone